MKRSDAFPVTAQPGEWLAEPITIHEVGPRDGLQAESTLTSAEEKIAFCTPTDRRLRMWRLPFAQECAK